MSTVLLATAGVVLLRFSTLFANAFSSNKAFKGIGSKWNEKAIMRLGQIVLGMLLLLWTAPAIGFVVQIGVIELTTLGFRRSSVVEMMIKLIVGLFLLFGPREIIDHFRHRREPESEGHRGQS